MSSFFRQAQDPVSCATHAWGAVAAFFGGMVLLLRALWTDVDMGTLAAAMVFAFSLMALYAASAMYHYCPGTVCSGGVKRRLRKLDHSMIYVLIAGSYTPFAMVLMPQPKGSRFCLIRGGGGGAGKALLDQRAPGLLHSAVSCHGLGAALRGGGLCRRGPALYGVGGGRRPLLLGGSRFLPPEKA